MPGANDVMTVEVSNQNDWLLVTVAGPIDYFNVDQLEQSVAQQIGDKPLVIIDLSQVTYLESSGLGWLISWQ